ncbi:MAG: nucleotidyltransferase [Anaerostipes sp.]|nr:nucleotidyltransferase [Anaerostipes sp.]MDD5968728.1 nucleotidyltransferase [Anaerostipes sp.]
MKKDMTLVVMAAGIGSRYGGGIKQLESVGPSGEIIMDYSVFDAKEAGFNKVVFIIRKDLEKDFHEIIGKRIEKVLPIEYAYQELDDIPEGFQVPAGRTKPWGTGQAILACKDLIHEPFVVINADDYYGKEAFVKLHQYLQSAKTKEEMGMYDISMAGFILGNTLSDNGAVTRGVCNTDEDQYLLNVVETKGIYLAEDGTIAHDENGSDIVIVPESKVSMNMWGFMPDIFQELETGFVDFLKEIPEGDISSEYLLPIIVDQLIQKKQAKVKMLPTNDSWFGITYKEDKGAVVKAFEDLIAKGVYHPELWK